HQAHAAVLGPTLTPLPLHATPPIAAYPLSLHDALPIYGKYTTGDGQLVLLLVEGRVCCHRGGAARFQGGEHGALADHAGVARDVVLISHGVPGFLVIRANLHTQRALGWGGQDELWVDGFSGLVQPADTL